MDEECLEILAYGMTDPSFFLAIEFIGAAGFVAAGMGGRETILKLHTLLWLNFEACGIFVEESQ